MMPTRHVLIGVAAVLVVGAAGFGAWLFRGDPAGGPQLPASAVDLSSLDRIPPETWERLAAKRVYFAHKSVGSDIAAGLARIAELKPALDLKVLEVTGPAADPGIAHADNGENHKPLSKIAAFSAALDAGPTPDIAILKFCFLDSADIAPSELFESYKAAIDGLRARHPQTTFVHVTMPLTSVQTGPRARAKHLLGGEVHGHSANKARNEYNRFLRAAYAGKEPFFDLAATEATRPDGKLATYYSDGAYDCLAAAYTHDGGHLNEAGQLAAARDLLLTLAKAVR